MAASGSIRGKRAGRSVRRYLRGQIWEVVKERWRPLVAVHFGWVAMGAVLVVVLRLLGVGEVGQAFTAGVVIGSAPLLWTAFLQGQGFSSRVMGADAEEWTAAALAKLDRRRWVVIDDVPLERGNVDHVAIGPGRVYAIETKWVGGPPKPAHLARLARQAASRAQALQRELHGQGVRRTATPLLVVWGRGVTEVIGPVGKHVKPTTVVAGRESENWLSRMDEAADRFVLDGPAIEAVRALTKGI